MTRDFANLDERLAAVHDQLTASVAQLTSSDAWCQMLSVAARFHRYSPNNLLLIYIQRPDATLVAGYRSWQQLGRHVSRGERSISILAPVLKRTKQETEGDPGEAAKVLRGFRVAHVFDLSQTEGKPLADTRPPLLAGGSPTGLWEQLADQVHAAGFTLDRGNCGGANGVTDHLRQHVRIRDDVSSAQGTKTLAHELAHVLLHGPDQPPRPRHVAEVEAESVAYVIGAAAGFPTEAYSVPYVAGWAEGDPAVTREAATRVLTTARLIIDRAGTPRDPLTPYIDPFDRSLAQSTERDLDIRLAS